jgi:hypothetical protein
MDMWIKMEVFDELRRIKGLKGTEQVQAGAKVLSRALRSDGLDLVDCVLQLVPNLRPGHLDFAFVLDRLKAHRTSRADREARGRGITIMTGWHAARMQELLHTFPAARMQEFLHTFLAANGPYHAPYGIYCSKCSGQGYPPAMRCPAEKPCRRTGEWENQIAVLVKNHRDRWDEDWTALSGTALVELSLVDLRDAMTIVKEYVRPSLLDLWNQVANQEPMVRLHEEFRIKNEDRKRSKRKRSE